MASAYTGSERRGKEKFLLDSYTNYEDEQMRCLHLRIADGSDEIKVNVMNGIRVCCSHHSFSRSLSPSLETYLFTMQVLCLCMCRRVVLFGAFGRVSKANRCAVEELGQQPD